MNNIKTKKLFILILAICLLNFTTCGTKATDEYNSDADQMADDNMTVTDYSDPGNWASIPGEKSSDVDVFCLYPTTFDGSNGDFADVEDEGMRQGADKWLETKASAFETSGNIYAPYYRQFNAEWFLTISPEEQINYLDGITSADVEAAFDYYIKNFNDGKPFILVGHSQGAIMIKTLLNGYLKENPDVMKRMVAAYVLGFYVTKDEIAESDHLKFAEGEDDTGVIISYNTVSPETDLSKLVVWHEGALSINPISWTRTENHASAEDNLGSNVPVAGEYTKVDNLADATVDKENGVIICDSLTRQQKEKYAISNSLKNIFSNGSYHGQDISFYYYNLRENAETRVKAFLIEHPEFNR